MDSKHRNPQEPNMEDWWKGLGQGRWSRAGCKSPVTHPTPYGISQVEDKAGGSVQRNEDESIVDLFDCSALVIWWWPTEK